MPGWKGAWGINQKQPQSIWNLKLYLCGRGAIRFGKRNNIDVISRHLSVRKRIVIWAFQNVFRSVYFPSVRHVLFSNRCFRFLDMQPYTNQINSCCVLLGAGEYYPNYQWTQWMLSPLRFMKFSTIAKMKSQEIWLVNFSKWSVLKLVRINHFNLYILILISWQYQTLAAETQQQKLILGDPLVSYNLLRSIWWLPCLVSLACKVNDIRLDVYIFIGLGALYSTDRSDTKSLDSHAVLFILINFSLAAYC